MERINHDNLKVLVRRVLPNPIRVEDTEALNTSSDPLFSNRLQVPYRFLLLHSPRGLRLAVRTTLGHGPFATSTAHSNAVNDKALLVFVSQAPGLIWSGRPGDAVNLGQLAVLPTADS